MCENFHFSVYVPTLVIFVCFPPFMAVLVDLKCYPRWYFLKKYSGLKHIQKFCCLVHFLFCFLSSEFTNSRHSFDIYHVLGAVLSSSLVLFHLLGIVALDLTSSPDSCMGFPDSSVGKESACNAGDLGSVLGFRRSAGEGIGYPLQYSGLENSMAYIVHGVTKSRTQLSDFHFRFVCINNPVGNHKGEEESRCILLRKLEMGRNVFMKPQTFNDKIAYYRRKFCLQKDSLPGSFN